MFQALYNTETRESVESVIWNMRKDLSVLLHEAINDDVRDHTVGARWLGPQLELDLDWLETYQQQKEKNMQVKATEPGEKIGTCGCGRSPTGDCIGWHGLTESEYQARLAEYQHQQETGK